jgi:hypothetical protein
METFMQMIKKNRSMSIFVGIVLVVVIASWLGL